MKLTNLVMATVICTSLIGCSTPYKKDGLMGGFEETQLDENVYQVSFSGNAYTRAAKAEDMALLRSADLTLQKGFKYFVLTDSNTDTDISTTPITSQSTGGAYGFGNQAFGSTTTTTSGGKIISRHSTQNTVVMFKEKPQLNTMVYNAEIICKSLGEKYNAECGAM